MAVLAYLLALTAILLVFQHLVRRYQTVAWVSLAALPLLLTPYWLRTCQADLFFWSKLYSVLLGAAWVIAIRYSGLGRKRFALRIVFLFAVLNISEAVIKDLLGGDPAHYLNAMSGLLLIATLVDGIDAIVVGGGGPYRDLLWDPFRGNMTRCWLACYMTWNWVFLYLNYPALAGYGTAALGSALLAAVGDRARYAQARVYTLAGTLLILFTFPSFVAEHMNTAAWSNPLGQQLSAALSFLLASSYAAWFVWSRLSSFAGVETERLRRA